MMNIEIIPNWHPVFRAFHDRAFRCVSTVVSGGVDPQERKPADYREMEPLDRHGDNGGHGAGGLYAYNTVVHDGPSHVAMLEHRNWALPTAGVFMTLALWAAWTQRGAKVVRSAFVAAMLLASGMLAVTGYKGGEAVYRHGIGVMRMPEIHGDGGHGSHSHEGMSEHHEKMMKDMSKKAGDHSDHSAHKH